MNASNNTEFSHSIMTMPLGPVMCDVQGVSLSEQDFQRLSHPLVGAVILFARNFESADQVSELIQQIRSIRNPQLLIAVDQEGGRVQRFKEGFTKLPPASHFGELWDKNKHTAPIMAYQSAYTMASELIAVGVDFSFAPVFDVTSKNSDVIGDRAFHSNPTAAAELLGAYIDGMHSAGMTCVAKHFPGHGGVSGDSHHCLPEDSRSFNDIQNHDLVPYYELVSELDGVMSAHVLFKQCDDHIPTYSSFWLQTVLRDQIGFHGVIFSDDLVMQGAIDAVDNYSIVSSAQKAIEAGCDMVLVCNSIEQTDELLAGLTFTVNEKHSARLSRLSAKVE